MRNAFGKLGGVCALSAMLAGCGGSKDAATPPGGLRIACATRDATFEDACFVERSNTEQGLVLTLHRPDGGFRRLLVARDGSGVAAADGADPVTVTLRSPTEMEVAVDGVRYRLPARSVPGKTA
ncbi:hypothetical protein LK533_04815 [Sphingomonas sp. PL-96]|uniref:hypothetical protein n=1 Tax=Sphingomonas sp. PL-96 TaxID=2887201 RepID=UPI001E30A809|nr:hypothetical protein [Sphingomonas sp. PL-96]MCC2975995.1 hypothetical protein [Sphingomonas sp. PL-96]